jgi:hypothetical protein
MKFNSKIFKFKIFTNKRLLKIFTNKSLLKILIIISILFFIFLITTYFNNEKIISLVNNKDIISFLLIGSVTQIVNLSISNIGKNILIPLLGIAFKKDLTKSIKINNVVINVNDLISNLIESLLNLFFLFFVLKNKI